MVNPQIAGPNMKTLLLASSAIVFAGSSFAADLTPRMPVKAPVIAAAYNWTGCYVGGHVGVGWSRTDFTDPGVVVFGVPVSTIAPAGTSLRVNSDPGVVGGAQAGCDYQFSNNWVIGVAGDFSAADLRGVVNDPFFAGKNPGPATLASRTDWLATVTGRLGYTWDRVLIYGKGGAAFAHDRYSTANFSAVSGGTCQVGLVFVACAPSASTDRIGWTAGAGIEWAFASNWTALVEYNHYGFGNKDLLFADPNAALGAAPISVKQNIDVVKVGINYRFGNPVVAKY
jgi:outer membrane immunogenic protein